MITKAIKKLLNSIYENTLSLHNAIRERKENNIKKIIKVMPDINKPLFSTVTALEDALSHNLYAIAFLLLDNYNANPNVATENRHHNTPAPLVRYFLEKHGLDAAKLLVNTCSLTNHKII